MSIKHLTWSLNDVIYGEPWYWKSVSEIFSTLTLENIQYKIEGVHTIPEIIQHMIEWRVFAIEHIKGNGTYDIKLNSTRDWKAKEIVDLNAFKMLLERYFDTQKELINLLRNKDDDWLKTKLQNRKYNFYFLLEGVIQHDLYHLGQISMLKKASEYRIQKT